jgi:hypothetical protein
MEPSILRCDVDAPDSAELRYYLRHAASLLAASDVESPQRAVVLRRARAWVVAALSGIDWNIRTIERDAIPSEIADRPTEGHRSADEILIPTLARPRRPE